MVRIVTLFFFLCIIVEQVNAQDLILTVQNDSIQCRIKDVKDGKIYFVPKGRKKREKFARPLGEIRNYEYDFYKKKKNKTSRLAHLFESKTDTVRNYYRFRIAIQGGYSYQTVLKVESGATQQYIDHKRKLRAGLHLGAEATYYFTSFLGIGAKVSAFNTKHKLSDFVVADAYGNKQKGILSDDILIWFAGPLLSTRYLHNNNKNAFISNIAIGYLKYGNDNTLLLNDYRYFEDTIGFVLDLGYDIVLYKNISAGVQFSYLIASLSEVSQYNGFVLQKVSLQKTEVLNRIDFSIGLRFNF